MLYGLSVFDLISQLKGHNVININDLLISISSAVNMCDWHVYNKLLLTYLLTYREQH